MRINYFSDIHLEFGELQAPYNDADIIIAAGDIGVHDQGISWLKSLKKPVIYVAGNHEFYKHSYLETLTSLSDQCRDSSIQFLENKTFVFQGVRFLGCTLWTDLFADGEDKAEALSLTLNDFKKISYADKPFDINKFTQLHRYSRTWLEQELAQPFNGKTIVVTHHAPSPWSWKDSPASLKKLAYCNDLRHLLHEYEITAWFHGHVHSRADYRIAGARILCNPRGYLGKKMVKDFDQNRIVEL